YEITESTTAPIASRCDSLRRNGTGAGSSACDSGGGGGAPQDLGTRTTLFEDASAQLGGHVHVDMPFDDWERQFLLPNALSQLGPGVAWFDYDRDGDEDLIVGTGKGGRLAVFRNDGGRLVPLPAAGPAASADVTTVLGLAGGAAGTRLLLGI